MYDKFHSWLTRAAKYPFPQTATQVQEAMLQYLTAHKEARAVQWFRDYMTGDREGKWMLAHSTIGSSANNMGNESYYKWVKDACNSKRNVSLNHFLGSYSAYLEDISALEYGKLLRNLAEESESVADKGESKGGGTGGGRKGGGTGGGRKGGGYVISMLPVCNAYAN